MGKCASIHHPSWMDDDGFIIHQFNGILAFSYKERVKESLI